MLKFIKQEIVLVIAFVLAVISVFIVPIDGEYISYIDFRTLAILFCLMAVMTGLRGLKVFDKLAMRLTTKVRSIRGVMILFAMLSFFSSMFITNDVALITFVPFTIIFLEIIDRRDALISLIVIETVAANLGSMLTPIGNPQNLYLYSIWNHSLIDFFELMWPYAALSFALIILLCNFVTRGDKRIISARSLEANEPFTKKSRVRIACYTAVFILAILVVARVIDYRIAFVISLVAFIAIDYKNLKEVDYSLLFTFVFLFVFIGNMKRIPAINDFLVSVTNGHEIAASVISSQVISNVPAAILLSGFTSRIDLLIVGTNLGGLGTLIASMASLISFKFYGKVEGANKKRYIIAFTTVNVLMLALLLALRIIIR